MCPELADWALRTGIRSWPRNCNKRGMDEWLDESRLAAWSGLPKNASRLLRAVSNGLAGRQGATAPSLSDLGAAVGCGWRIVGSTSKRTGLSLRTLTSVIHATTASA